jgi:hypothetical protein
MVRNAVISKMFFPKYFLDPHADEDSERSIAEIIIQQKQ